jgi:hypothetical protein
MSFAGHAVHGDSLWYAGSFAFRSGTQNMPFSDFLRISTRCVQFLLHRRQQHVRLWMSPGVRPIFRSPSRLGTRGLPVLGLPTPFRCLRVPS